MKGEKSHDIFRTINLFRRKESNCKKLKKECNAMSAHSQIKSKSSSFLDRIDSIYDSQLSKIYVKNLISKSQNDEIYFSNVEESIPIKSCLKTGRWTKEEHNNFINAILKYGNDWKKVQQCILTRNSTQARSHAQKFFLRLRKKFNLNREKDYSLDYINQLPKEIIRSTNLKIFSFKKQELDRLLNVLVNFNPKRKFKNSIEKDDLLKIESDIIKNTEENNEVSGHHFLNKKRYFSIVKIFNSNNYKTDKNLLPFSHKNENEDHNSENNTKKITNFCSLNLKMNKRIINPQILECPHAKFINDQNIKTSNSHYPENNCKTQYNINNHKNPLFEEVNSTFCSTTNINNLLLKYNPSSREIRDYYPAINQCNEIEKLFIPNENELNSYLNIQMLKHEELNNQDNFEDEDIMINKLIPNLQPNISILNNLSYHNNESQEKFFLDEVFLNDNISNFLI